MSAAATAEGRPTSVEIAAHLADVLESPQFRSSRRCQELLRFLVREAAEGRHDALKERVIGVEVFNRPADYNPGSDPIVRVSVAEVRKRLAQYYQDAAPGKPRIRIATGQYVPEFSWGEAPAAAVAIAPPAPVARLRRRWRWAVAAAAVASSVAVWAWTRPPDPLDAFWGPAFHSRQSVLILTEPYGSGSVIHRFNAEMRNLREDPPPGLKLLTADIAATFGQSVMSGNVFALRSLDRLFSGRGREPEVRIGGGVTLADQAERPVILIGYFNNPWAKNMNTEQLRFTLTTEHRDNRFLHVIRDLRDPSRQWSITSDRPWFEDTPVSYAIVTRIFDRHSGRFLVSIAGMTHLATCAAAEFTTRPAYLQALQAQAPKGWEQRNSQAVLETQIVNQTASPPKLVGSYSW